MRKSKKAPKRKTASVKDLRAKSSKTIVGGRQTSGTNFGSVLGTGIAKTP